MVTTRAPKKATTKKGAATSRSRTPAPTWTTARKRKLLAAFEELYPEPSSELNFKNNYELVVSVVLSAQCTDKKVNEVTPTLFRKYRGFKALSEAAVEDVEQIIRPVNYYKTKSKNLVNLGKNVCENFSGKLPTNSRDLITLPGVGQKTANVVVSELGTEYSFPVDTHVFRVSQRLGLVEGKTPEIIEEEMKKIFPAESWRSLHHWLIFHGRRVCSARKPECESCTIEKLCHQVL